MVESKDSQQHCGAMPGLTQAAAQRVLLQTLCLQRYMIGCFRTGPIPLQLLDAIHPWNVVSPLNLTRNSCTPSTVLSARIASTLSASVDARPRRAAAFGLAGACFLGAGSPLSSESTSSLLSDCESASSLQLLDPVRGDLLAPAASNRRDELRVHEV